MGEPRENAKIAELDRQNSAGVLRAFLRPCFSFVPFLVILLFLGALFWARELDPFSRKWFTVKTANGSSVKCVAVLPKPIRPCPVVVYAHGSGGTLMSDGFELRQMAEMGLATVSVEYDQNNNAAVNDQFAAVLRYIDRQKWANTNAIAWVGFSRGANRMWDFALQHPKQQPQLLVQLSGAGMDQSDFDGRRRGDAAQTSTNVGTQSEPPHAGSHGMTITNLHCPVLLIHGGQDEIFPLADTARLFSALRSNSASAELRILPGVSHGLEPERGVVFRCIGEYCLTHLAGRKAWRNYHSIAEWQMEAPPFWLFCLPAVAWVIGWAVRSRYNNPSPQPSPRLAGKGGSRGRWLDAGLRALAVILSVWALSDTALHLLTPEFTVSDRTLSVARRMLVQPKELADFETLARQPIWRGEKLKILLDHVELADYNRTLINWRLDDVMYRDYVLSPVITSSTANPQSATGLSWRRALWEEFYPRIRHESSPTDAATIVVRHLRERVTIASVPNLPHDVPTIWLRQITDEAGFEMIYVAALRSVGVPARLNEHNKAELFADDKWQVAPKPIWN